MSEEDDSEEVTIRKPTTLNVVITGASSGVGAALAKAMTSEGHKVVIAARREGKLHSVAVECHGKATVVPTDVTQRAAVEALRDKAIATLGHIDVWVNNAGRGIGRKVQDLTDLELDEMMLINVKAALYGMQAVLPHFLERKAGHIINVASVLARVPVASSRSAFSAAGAALAALTANLRMDLSPINKDIHVSLLLPGHIGDTSFFDAVLGSKLAPPGRLPTQTAEEIADIIAGIIEYPRSEVYTSPVLRGLLRQYQADLESFEEAMSPAPSLPTPNMAGLAERIKIKMGGGGELSMGIAATNFAKTRSAQNFQAWVQEAPADAAGYLKRVATQTGNTTALTTLDGLDATPPEGRAAALGTLFTQVGAAQLGTLQAARAEGLGWQANGPPKQAPSLTGKMTVENNNIMLDTPAGKFKVTGQNMFAPQDIAMFANRVCTVRGWPDGAMPADGTAPAGIVISEFAPGTSPDFATGRLSVENGEVFVQTGGEKKVHITDPTLKAALSGLNQLGVVLPGPVERQGNEWVFATSPKDYYVLAGFAVAGTPPVGPDQVSFNLQMAHGHQVPCDMTRAAWDAAPHTSRHYVYGHFDAGKFVATGLTPTGAANAYGGTPIESSAFVELATPVETPKWTADDAKFGM